MLGEFFPAVAQERQFGPALYNDINGKHNSDMDMYTERELAPHGGEADEGLYALLVPPAESLAAAVGVLVEERHAREGLPAAGARVLLGLQVRLQVRAQVRLVGEGARAVRARERLLARVRPKEYCHVDDY